MCTMKRLITFISVLVAFALYQTVSAQDIITSTDGKVIEAIVMEIDEDELEYKLFDKPHGPNHDISIKDILSISYENGWSVDLQYGEEYPYLPLGRMSYNIWNGDASVAGVTLDKSYFAKYLPSKDYYSFRTAHVFSRIGKGFLLAGTGVAIGGFVIMTVLFHRGNSYAIDTVYFNPDLLLASSFYYIGIAGACMAALGLVVSIPSNIVVYSIVDKYNNSLPSYNPELKLGLAPHGVGVTFTF